MTDLSAYVGTWLFALARSAATDVTAVLVVSSELSELQSLCDRFIVLRGGRIAATFDRAASREALLASAMG